MANLPEGIDRISSLPEDLLCHILSLLPTKYVVATSLLSTRWKFLWTYISTLNFDDDDEYAYTHSREVKFTQFVNSVLLRLNPPCIHNFHLSLKNHRDLCDRSNLHSWICAAIERNVQNMHLDLELYQSIELPLSQFNCKTLAVLMLNGGIHFNIDASTSICFPNLSTLHLSEITFTFTSNCSVSFPSLKDLLLHVVEFANEESVHKLFASCPVLENLEINRTFWDNVLCLNISMPSLRSLKSYFSSFVRHPLVCKLQMDTPALKYLYLENDYMLQREYFTEENLSSLLEAKVHFGFYGSLTIDANSYYINIFKFIGCLVNVKFLSISVGILKAISSISANVAPVFRNLTRLELSGEDSCRDWSVVTKFFLESSDNLEHLVMNGSKCRRSHESCWTEPLCVPMCLQRRVSKISFSLMNLCSNELELVRYILKNAKVLEVLTFIHMCGWEGKSEMMQEISMIPRGSEACQVVFRGSVPWQATFTSK